MCGFIAGLFHEETVVTPERMELFKKANGEIVHRGPDDEGYFHDQHMSMAFRRLSIIDKENGHQPYSYANGRYMITFNGEIYNHIELRETLKSFGITCETSSDTEVLVALYAAIGKDVVYKIRGMFSFLIWDTIEKTLFGARDHFGIKPFYYADRQDGIFFASEKKSLLPFIHHIQIDKDSLQHYLAFQYVPEPKTMDTIVRKVPPGSYFIKKAEEETCTFIPYWKSEFRPSSSTNEEQEMKNIREALSESVEKHMRSDVPVGAFLSGGIDSTIIVSLASQLSPTLKTFSVGFEDENYSEVDVAEKTASMLGTNHHSYLIKPEEFINELPKIIWHLDDPVADPAAVPLYFVAREARKQVTVVLSGEGSDELFAGYNIYKEPDDLAVWKYIPHAMKKILLSSSRKLPEGMKGKSFIYRGCTKLENRYIGNAHIFKDPELSKVLAYPYDTSFKTITDQIYQQVNHLDDVSKMQTIDMNTWLKGDILTKADRMTMAHSLELRVPFLDKEVFKVAASLPASSKIQNGVTKALLRKAFKDIIPSHVVNRKKLGFPVPIRIWLKHELYDWTVSLIENSHTENLLNKAYAKHLLDEHALGKHDYSRKLWTIITFMLWHKQFVENGSSKKSGEQGKLLSTIY
ncbi:asparagine synthase (glutamine-hydrolyzing) [Metabacillus rhizolycopersici]|uniref:asparagine synthase (glutamine-hydrolyzing) n=1 Tax=Metabacillus rhizolycopersici TaxID=2875709 RepID=A0ABS7UU34_9BACI|nr:asparagine synthase (glutamine-hydrolyzing) [Metabacillus rhizolycopersici]MBZ5751572.1 asparagine synthase (glutamine-hydrolyzing) [Metabacillus rhizolycopersici]